VSEVIKTKRFEETVMPHLHAAYNLARWLVRSEQDAQDVVQEAYLRAFKFFDSFKGDDARPWLLTIVRNTSYSHLEKNRSHATQLLPLDEALDGIPMEGSATLLNQADNNPEAILARMDEQRFFHAALEQLPVEFREALVLRELENLSYKEISVIAGIPIGTVMSRLARARKLLLECLTRMQPGAIG
jgi:RNA polymerase sigma factor (sigma-70 family)